MKYTKEQVLAIIGDDEVNKRYTKPYVYYAPERNKLRAEQRALLEEYEMGGELPRLHSPQYPQAQPKDYMRGLKDGIEATKKDVMKTIEKLLFPEDEAGL